MYIFQIFPVGTQKVRSTKKNSKMHPKMTAPFQNSSPSLFCNLFGKWVSRINMLQLPCNYTITYLLFSFVISYIPYMKWFFLLVVSLISCFKFLVLYLCCCLYLSLYFLIHILFVGDFLLLWLFQMGIEPSPRHYVRSTLRGKKSHLFQKSRNIFVVPFTLLFIYLHYYILLPI